MSKSILSNCATKKYVSDKHALCCQHPFSHQKMHKIQKYTEFSSSTGITKQNQTILHDENTDTKKKNWTKEYAEYVLNAIAERSSRFVSERAWQHHDTATNLQLALASEVGELAGIFAWTGDCVRPAKYSDIRDKAAQELADITILLVRVCAQYNIDLVVAFS